MKRSKGLCAGAALLMAGALLAPAQEPTPPPAGEARKITVTAKKYEFNPSRIELKAGEPVEITFEAEDTTHGFTCKELGVDKVVFEKGKPETVKLTPEKPGTYEFKCAKFCGFGHGKMKGEFVVTAAEAPKN
jgi:cytochrome c oxidase subunit II